MLRQQIKTNHQQADAASSIKQQTGKEQMSSVDSKNDVTNGAKTHRQLPIISYQPVVNEPAQNTVHRLYDETHMEASQARDKAKDNYGSVNKRDPECRAARDAFGP